MAKENHYLKRKQKEAQRAGMDRKFKELQDASLKTKIKEVKPNE